MRWLSESQKRESADKSNAKRGLVDSGSTENRSDNLAEEAVTAVPGVAGETFSDSTDTKTRVVDPRIVARRLAESIKGKSQDAAPGPSERETQIGGPTNVETQIGGPTSVETRIDGPTSVETRIGEPTNVETQIGDPTNVETRIVGYYDTTAAAADPLTREDDTDDDRAMVPGTRIGRRYEIVRFVASGGMGHVYEALDRNIKQRIAIKVVRRQLAGNLASMDRVRAATGS